MSPLGNATRKASCLALLMFLVGCGGEEHEDIRQWMAQASKDLRGSAPPLPQLHPFPMVSYDAQDLPDPFSAARIEPDQEGAAGANQPDMDRPREFLETFPLDALQYIGLVSKTARQERRAIIRVGDVLYQVGIGNYMGQNFGRIVAIDDAEITLMETVQDPSGQTSAWVERETTLSLLGGTAGEGGNK